MQLQSKLHEFTAAGIDVFSLSYDAPEALSDFRDAYGIAYTQLSDPDSKIIRSFGILNTLISEDDTPFFGVPYPGTYVVDSSGVITQKFFEKNHIIRSGIETVLRAAKNELLDQPNVSRPAPRETTWHVSLGAAQLTMGVMQDVIARLEAPAGHYFCASSALQDLVSLELLLDDHPDILTRGLVKPTSEALTLIKTGEVLPVFNTAVELRLPITLTGELFAVAENPVITLTGILRWQTCTEEKCDAPREEAFELSVSIAEVIMPEIVVPANGGAVRDMNGAKHFERMMARKK